jgi:hypothetical protein
MCDWWAVDRPMHCEVCSSLSTLDSASVGITQRNIFLREADTPYRRRWRSAAAVAPVVSANSHPLPERKREHRKDLHGCIPEVEAGLSIARRLALVANCRLPA